MPQPRARPAPCCLLLLLLLLLLLISWPPPGAALALTDPRGPRSPQPTTPDPDGSSEPELRRRLQDLLARLRANQTRAAALDPAPAPRILAPQVQLESDGRVHLRLSRASLTEDLPEAHRLQRALLRLSPSAPRAWDVTRQLRRELSLGGPRAPTLHLRLSRALSLDLTAAGSPSGPPQLELHLRAPAARGRRSARDRDDCPLGPGRCCRLHTVRASLEDLGWTDWVLSPRELHVSLCAGECPSRYRAASTHAQVKARLHGLKPDTVPAPCCVPSGYDLTVLLHKTDSGVSLKTYDDLQAKGCHCA